MKFQVFVTFCGVISEILANLLKFHGTMYLHFMTLTNDWQGSGLNS